MTLLDCQGLIIYVLINTTKSKCAYYRKTRHGQSQFEFKIGSNTQETVREYKYLGVIFSDTGNYTAHCEAISKGAGRALSGIIYKIKNLKDFGYKSYEKLYNNCVIPMY